jgi:hypothetical protein
MARAIDEAKHELDLIASKLQSEIAEWERRTGLKLVRIDIRRIETSSHTEKGSLVSVLCTAEVEIEGRA